MKKLLVLMLALLLVMPMVSSTKVALVGSANDLSIIIPRFDYFEINQNYTLNVHASNISRVLTNKTTSCYADLYNNNGKHLFKNQIPYSSADKEWEVYINPNNFSKLGELNLVVWCNSSTQVGLIDIILKVTPTGEILTTSQAILHISFIILLFIILVTSLMAVKILPHDKRDEEGSLLSISYLKHLKYALWIFAYFMAIAILFVSANVCLAYLGATMMGDLLFKLYQIAFGLSPLLIIVMALSFFSRLNTDKEFKQMLNRGMLPGSV